MDSPLYDRFVLQNPSTVCYPPQDYPDLIRELVMPAAPKGLSEVILTEGTGSIANEQAIKAAFIL
jgi:hypothetical protein